MGAYYRPEGTRRYHAAVLGIFHAEVQQFGTRSSTPRPQSMEFMWVRWLGVVEGHKYGRTTGQLPKVAFISDDDDDAFGFLDPSLVIRGAHLIPSFVDGNTLEPDQHTGTRADGSLNEYSYYYVNM